ncbi:GlcG/HbpS family heme-binding protein [Bradyrhizobium sp. 41S5]|uniref:GlcG/HbpS family heme-binding protein n=1 Tax=Bradyrhizobium sp. 41S5 TaxID=1404443 RepID=UPI00211281BC|nr:heme-binding protein [Bradyrhizobium sp. 41S5]
MSPRSAALALLAIAIAASLLASPALAVELPSRPALSLEAARTAVIAAEAKANAGGWPCVISVVDNKGLPILLEYMDDAVVLDGVELAPAKARIAALFRESGALVDAINGRRLAELTARASS